MILDLLVDSLDVESNLVLVTEIFLALGARESKRNRLHDGSM